MSDDKFFNKGINDGSSTGFTAVFIDTTGHFIGVGTFFASAPNSMVRMGLPPATVGAGAKITVVIDDTTNPVVVVANQDVDPDDTINGGGPDVSPPQGVHTFISDGVSNWTYTA